MKAIDRHTIKNFSVGAFSLLPFEQIPASGFACVTYWRHNDQSPLHVCVNVGISHNHGKYEIANSAQLCEDDFLASHPFFLDEELALLKVEPGDVISLRRPTPSSWCDAASVYLGAITPIGMFPTHDAIAKHVVNLFVQGREKELMRMLWGTWERADKEKSCAYQMCFYPANLGGMTLSAKPSFRSGSIGGMACDLC